MKPIVICALYKFTALAHYKSLREPLRDFMEQHGIRGTLLLAREGINGTVAGSGAAIEADWKFTISGCPSVIRTA